MQDPPRLQTHYKKKHSLWNWEWEFTPVISTLRGWGEDHHGQPGLQSETVSKQSNIDRAEGHSSVTSTCSTCSRPNMRERTDSCKAVLTATPMLQYVCLYTCTWSKLKCNINNNVKDMPPQSIVIKYHFNLCTGVPYKFSFEKKKFNHYWKFIFLIYFYWKNFPPPKFLIFKIDWCIAVYIYRVKRCFNKLYKGR